MIIQDAAANQYKHLYRLTANSSQATTQIVLTYEKHSPFEPHIVDLTPNITKNKNQQYRLQAAMLTCMILLYFSQQSLSP